MKNIDWCVALFSWYVLSGFGIRVMLISKMVGKHSLFNFILSVWIELVLFLP